MLCDWMMIKRLSGNRDKRRVLLESDKLESHRGRLIMNDRAKTQEKNNTNCA